MEDGEIRSGQGRPVDDASRTFSLDAGPRDPQEAGWEPDACTESGEGILRGRIVTGMPLSNEEQRRITKRFEELLGKPVILSCRVDRKQLAGIRVELNGYSYDGTLRGQLTTLHKMLTRPDEEVR